jgi:predicted O-methyltransferase YrrM
MVLRQAPPWTSRFWKAMSVAEQAVRRGGATQAKVELAALLALLTRQPPGVVVEIGTAEGGTFFALAQVARDDACLVRIDLPNGPFGGVSGFTPHARPGQEVHVIRADSHDLHTRRELEEVLAGRPIDVLFIDGDHTYDGVRGDYTVYGSLVRRGGLIALHDVVPGPRRAVGDVPRFWGELHRRSVSRTFVRDWRQGGLGIGVVRPR